MDDVQVLDDRITKQKSWIRALCRVENTLPRRLFLASVQRNPWSLYLWSNGGTFYNHLIDALAAIRYTLLDSSLTTTSEILTSVTSAAHRYDFYVTRARPKKKAPVTYKAVIEMLLQVQNEHVTVTGPLCL